MPSFHRHSASPMRGLQRVAAKKRRLLLIGVLAVCLPLSLMMGLQYWWLARLKASSTTARTVTQEQFLTLLSQKVDFFYARMADQLLTIPSDKVMGDRGALSEYVAMRFKWANKSNYGKEMESSLEVEEAQVAAGGAPDAAPETVPQQVPVVDPLFPESAYKPDTGWAAGKKKMMPWEKLSEAITCMFATSFRGDHAGTFLFQDHYAGTGTAVHPVADLDETVRWACRRWTKKVDDVNVLSGEFIVDQRDDRYPMILNPILDGEGAVAGMTGIVVNPVFFRSEVLPGMVKALERVLDGQKDWRVWIYDSAGELVLTTGAGPFDKSNHTEEKTTKLPFVFSDWSVTLSTHPSRLEQLAGTNFYMNITLSAVLALSLVGGLLLAFGTAARELQLSEMKSDFVSNVSHELRTPLASIRVFGELLRLGRTSDPDKVKEYGAYIENEGRRLSRLINNILDFSKIESDQKMYRFRKADLEAVLRDVMETFRVRLHGEGIPVAYHGPDEALPLMALDVDALGQVFFNLLDNGVKYGRPGNRLDVTLRREADRVVVAFQDRGVGIARAERDKIFERFHRVGTGLVHDVKGSGLGLSIVRHVVSAHHGEVSVSGRLGEGSTFTLTLPLHGPPVTEDEDEA